MSAPQNRFFKLSLPVGQSGLSCDATGAFIEDIPLLKREGEDGSDSAWIARSTDELSEEIGARYGLPVDLSSRVEGLDAIARALNTGEVARAQMATVLLAFPEVPTLSKGALSSDALEQFARELYRGGLLKADWDPDEHPRWPTGSPDSQGGQFAPKDEASSGADGSSQSDASFPGARTESDDARDDESLRPADSASLIPAVEHGEDEGTFDPIAYQGYFHDEVVEGLAQYFRQNGFKAETEVPIEMADGSGGTRIDILVKGPHTVIAGIEVKTGGDPPFTKAQLYITFILT